MLTTCIQLSNPHDLLEISRQFVLHFSVDERQKGFKKYAFSSENAIFGESHTISLPEMTRFALS